MLGRVFALLMFVLLVTASGCKEEPQPKVKGTIDPNLQPATLGPAGKPVQQAKPQ